MPDQPDIEGLLGAIQGQIGQSPIHQFSPLGQLGAGLAGLGAGMQGQANPVLEQARLQRDATLRQQLEMIRLQQSVQVHRQQKNELLLKLNTDMLASATDPAARGHLAQERAKFYEALSGTPVPQSVVSNWGQRTFTPEQEKKILVSLLDRPGNPEALRVTATRFNLTPEDLGYFTGLLQKPAALKAMLGFTPTSLQKEADEAKKTKVEAWLAENPQFKDAGILQGVAGHAESFVRKIYQKSLFDLTSQNPDDAKILTAAADFAQRRSKTSALELKQAESDIIKQREIDVAKAKATSKATEPKPLSQRERALVLKPFDTADTALAELETMMGAASRLNAQGYLATDTTWLAQNWAQFQRWWDKSGDPDVLLIKQLTAPVTIGLIDRGLNDEKGTRAMQMFHAQIEIVNKFPTMRGYQTLFGFYQYLFGRLAAKQLRRIESQIGKLPDDVVEEAQRMYLEMFPKGLPPDPTAPQRRMP